MFDLLLICREKAAFASANLFLVKGKYESMSLRLEKRRALQLLPFDDKLGWYFDLAEGCFNLGARP